MQIKRPTEPAQSLRQVGVRGRWDGSERADYLRHAGGELEYFAMFDQRQSRNCWIKLLHLQGATEPEAYPIGPVLKGWRWSAY